MVEVILLVVMIIGFLLVLPLNALPIQFLAWFFVLYLGIGLFYVVKLMILEAKSKRNKE